MKYLLFFSIFLLSACNIYELIGSGNQYSDNFEDLISRPSISFKPQQISITEINAATATGVDIEFTISNAQFNDFLNAGKVDYIAGATEDGPGSATGLTMPSFATKTSSNRFIVNVLGTSATVTGEVFLRVLIPISSYTSNSNLDLLHEEYFVELVP